MFIMSLKRMGVLIIGVLTLVVMAGCSKATTPATADATTKTVAQAPDRIAEVYGLVKSIVGNEVILQLAEPPNSQPLPEKDKEKRRSEMQALSPEERQKIKDSQTKFTGENGTIIIPVGTPIVSGSTPETMKEMSLTDIRAGVFLRIWLEGGSGEAKTAEYVRLLQSQ